MEGDRYCVNEPSVISEVIDGETIVLNFESGHYYSFNATASEIWAQICAGAQVATTTAWVSRRFSGDAAAIQAEVATFLQRLADEQLIRIAPPDAAPRGAAAEPPSSAPLGAFSPPSFEKFTDMEELLLLDPIHEVGDTGWPRKAD